MSGVCCRSASVEINFIFPKLYKIYLFKHHHLLYLKNWVTFQILFFHLSCSKVLVCRKSSLYLAGIYLLIVNNKNTRTKVWSGVVLLSLLLTLNIFHTFVLVFLFLTLNMYFFIAEKFFIKTFYYLAKTLLCVIWRHLSFPKAYYKCVVLC